MEELTEITNFQTLDKLFSSEGANRDVETILQRPLIIRIAHIPNDSKQRALTKKRGKKTRGFSDCT